MQRDDPRPVRFAVLACSMAALAGCSPLDGSRAPPPTRPPQPELTVGTILRSDPDSVRRLEGYETGAVTEKSFLSDGWTIEACAQGRIGVLRVHTEGGLRWYELGAFSRPVQDHRTLSDMAQYTQLLRSGDLGKLSVGVMDSPQTLSRGAFQGGESGMEASFLVNLPGAKTLRVARLGFRGKRLAARELAWEAPEV